jgi:hypothetical protein
MRKEGARCGGGSPTGLKKREPCQRRHGSFLVPGVMFQIYLAEITRLIPAPLMGEGQGGSEIISRLYCINPPPPHPLPPGEGEFKAMDL